MKLLISNLPTDQTPAHLWHHSKILIKSSHRPLETLELNEGWKILLWKMVATCLKEDGIGLAAPQIGIFRRTFIIRDLDGEGKLLESFTAYFEPSFTAVPKTKVEGIEGCLSVPEGGFVVARYPEIQATWWELDSEGRPFKQETLLTGLRAIVFQHELDHLNGITLIQRGIRKR